MTTTDEKYSSSEWTMSTEMQGGFSSNMSVSAGVGLFGLVDVSYNKIIIIFSLILFRSQVFAATLNLWATTNFSQTQITSTSTQSTWSLNFDFDLGNVTQSVGGQFYYVKPGCDAVLKEIQKINKSAKKGNKYIFTCFNINFSRID